MTTPQGRAVIALLLILLVASLMACATPSAPPIQPPALPKPPAELMEDPQPGLWSDTVRSLFLQWQKLLTPVNPA